MSIRKINYTVTAESITPASLQRGGIQGEHNATELDFLISQSLAEKLEEAAAHISFEDYAVKGEIYYRFEGHTAIGLKNSTLPIKIEISDAVIKEFTLNYLLENWLTREGGNIMVYLIFSILSPRGTHIDLYSYPAKLKLDAVPDGKYTDGENYESVAKLSVAATEAAERAEEAAEVSEAAKEQTVSARFALENGAEFIFMGGNAKGAAEVDLVVDTELSEHSSNPISNEAVAKEFQKYTPKEQADEIYVGSKDYTLDKKTAENERNKLKEDFENIADYIVEQGIKDGWAYRKWNSGIAECWGTTTGSCKITEAAGSIFRSTTSFSENLPPIFIETPICNVTLTSNQNNWPVFPLISLNVTKTTTPTVLIGYHRSVDNQDIPFLINWVVIGIWNKEE